METKVIKLKYAADNSDFYFVLRQRVHTYLSKTGTSGKANNFYFIKVGLIASLFFFTYSLIYFGHAPGLVYLIYGILGILSIVLGINTAHDGAHGAVFRKERYNRLFTYVFELLGTSSSNWKHKHVTAHHPFPNIPGHDSDIGQSRITRIFPSDPHRPIHAFQHLYMPLLYALYLFRWIFYRDFKDVFSRGANGAGATLKGEIIRLIVFKILFLCYMVFIPAMVTPFSFGVIWGSFFLFTVTGSLTMAIVLVSTHVGTEVDFPLPDANGNLPYGWAQHQLETTSDFAPQNHFLTHFTGGFNHHVIHHLFPGICHVHYPSLTPILAQTAAEFGLPYKHTRSLGEAITSHFRLLKRNSLTRKSAGFDWDDF